MKACIKVYEPFIGPYEVTVNALNHAFGGWEQGFWEDYLVDTETEAYLLAAFAALVLTDEGYTVVLDI